MRQSNEYRLIRVTLNLISLLSNIVNSLSDHEKQDDIRKVLSALPQNVWHTLILYFNGWMYVFQKLFDFILPLQQCNAIVLVSEFSAKYVSAAGCKIEKPQYQNVCIVFLWNSSSYRFWLRKVEPPTFWHVCGCLVFILIFTEHHHNE